jgi:hypothetical protein
VLGGIDDGASRAIAAGLAAEAERVSDGDDARLRVLFTDSYRRIARHRALSYETANDDQPPAERPATESSGPGVGLDRLREVREAHRRFGGDPSRAPRPAV